jgi:hypothetical protein
MCELLSSVTEEVEEELEMWLFGVIGKYIYTNREKSVFLCNKYLNMPKLAANRVAELESVSDNSRYNILFVMLLTETRAVVTAVHECITNVIAILYFVLLYVFYLFIYFLFCISGEDERRIQGFSGET